MPSPTPPSRPAALLGGPSAAALLRGLSAGALAVAGLVGGTAAAWQSEPAPARLSAEQLLALREASHIMEQAAERVWPGWSEIPLTTLLVDSEHEYLVSPPASWSPAGGFVATEQRFDDRPVFRRRRTLPRALRAAFPVAGVPAAVVGVWQPSEESPNEWVVTLAHEWFHVLQLYRGEPDKVAELALGPRDDPSWQLAYPFPYDDPDVAHALQLLGGALYDFWSRSRELPRERQRDFHAETVWAALQNLRTVLTLKHGEAPYRYFLFQTWKEGGARYAAVHLARRLAEAEIAEHFRHVPGFGLLQGASSYTRLWDDVVQTNYWMIRSSGGPGERDRTGFYALGHGLAELLDAILPEWKSRYFEPGVWLDDLVAEALGGR